jgi:MATE family multidrug resistance protein
MFSKKSLSHHKQTFLLAYPVCISQLGHIMVGVVDTLVVGQLGSVQLAAAALSNSIFSLVMVLGIGISFGVTPLVAAADGNKDDSANMEWLRNMIVTSLISGIGLFLILFSCSPVLSLLDQPGEVVKMAIPFFRIQILSLIPLMIFLGFKQFAEGLSYTRQAMVISIAANVVNMILNYVFVFGKGGFEPMGMNGSVWATFIARVLMAIVMGFYIFYNPRFLKYRAAFRLKYFSIEKIKKIFSLGIPIGFQYFFEVGAFAFAAIMAGWIGTKELAAHQIALILAATTYMMASGIASASTVRVGNHIGRKDLNGMREAGFSAYLLVFCFMFCCALIFILLNNFLPTLFIKEQDVIEIAAILIVVAAFFQLSDGIQCVGLGILRGLEDVKTPTFIALVSY